MQNVKEVSAEVFRALRDFAATDRVPRSVIEANIFRRPYFVNQFMPNLLAFGEMTEVRDRFVSRLATEGITKK